MGTVKRDTTVEPLDGDNSKGEQKTLIASVPWRRNTGRRGIMQLTDYYEIGLY